MENRIKRMEALLEASGTNRTQPPAMEQEESSNEEDESVESVVEAMSTMVLDETGVSRFFGALYPIAFKNSKLTPILGSTSGLFPFNSQNLRMIDASLGPNSIASTISTMVLLEDRHSVLQAGICASHISGFTHVLPQK